MRRTHGPRLAAAPLLAAVLLALAGPFAGGQDGVARAPALPKEMAEEARRPLVEAIRLLARGQFEAAAARLAADPLPATVRVFVDAAAVPRRHRAAYREAVQNALQGWNTALGAPRFQATENAEEADLVVLFERRVALRPAGAANASNATAGAAEAGSSATAITPSVPVAPGFAPVAPGFAGGLNVTLACVDTTVERDTTASPPRRSGQIRIALLEPDSDRPHAPASIGHLAAHGLGAWLGLGPTASAADAMGPDTHTDAVALRPSADDLARVRQIEQARAFLIDSARRRVALTIPTPALTLERTEQDAGDVWRGDDANFRFTLKNTGQAPLEIDAVPNCGCTVSTFDKVIPPGKEGHIQAALRTAGFIGKVTKGIEVTTNDPDRPHLRLQIVARVRPVVEALPSDRPVIALEDGKPTVHEMELRIHEPGAVQVQRAVSSAAYASAEVAPLKTAPNAYRLRLTVLPQAPVGRSVVRIQLLTNSTREPQSYITATLEKGICAVPVSVYLGAIGPATPLPVQQVVTLTRRGKPFRVVSAAADDPNLTVTASSATPGAECRLTVGYRGGWGPGVVQRRVTVTTDDPQQPKIEIPVVAGVMEK